MIHIERLRLQLPARCAPWAGEIGRWVAQDLARADLAGPENRARLDVPPVSVPADAGPREVARLVAGSIRESLGGEP